MQQSRTAAEIVGNLGAWENRWKWTPPTVNEPIGSSSSASQPDNRNLQQQLDSVKGQLKEHQQAADRATSLQNMHGPAKKQKGGGDGGGSQGSQGKTQYWNGGGGGTRGGKPWLASQKKGGGKRK